MDTTTTGRQKIASSGAEERRCRPTMECFLEQQGTIPDQIKTIVNLADYEKVEVEPDRTFLMRKSMSAAERAGYVVLLQEYLDVFAWSPDDLQGIPPEFGLHHIDPPRCDRINTD